MQIIATVKPGDRRLSKIDAVRLNGAFLDFDQSKKVLDKYCDKVTIVDLPNGRTKPRTNNYTDQEIADWAIKNEVDYLAVSYVNSPKDLKYDYDMIAKIETKAGLNNLVKIMNKVSIVMVDRYDLAQAIGWEKLPFAVDKICKIARLKGCYVMMASKVLPTMAETGEPTVTEAMNLFDLGRYAHGVVLEETAYGENPQKIVNFVKKII